MERKNITITDEQSNWVEQKDCFNLSQEVQEMLDEKIENEDWSVTTVSHNNGMKLCRNSIVGEHNQFNPFDFPQGLNGLTLGDIGVGATVTNMLGLSQMVDQSGLEEDPLVIMIDQLGSLSAFTEEYGGTRFDVASDDFNLNPLELAPPAYDTERDGKNVFMHLKGLLQTIFTENQEEAIHGDQMVWDVLYETLNHLYREAFDYELGSGYPTSADAMSDKNRINNQITIRDHLIPELWKVSIGDSTVNDVEDMSDIDIQYCAQMLLDSLAVFRNGDQFHSQLTSDRTVEVPSDENLVCLDCSRVSESKFQTFYMLYLQAFRWAQLIERPTIIYIDEARELYRNKHAHNLLESTLRHARHYETCIQINGGSIDSFAEYDFNQTLIDLCGWITIHRSKNIGLESYGSLRSKLELDQIHVEYIQNCRPGTAERGYSEAVMTFPETGWQPVRISPQTEKQESLIG